MSKRGRRRDEIDWKDDLLVGIQLAICIILGIMFYNFLTQNPEIAAYLMPTEAGLFLVSFGVFIGIFLLVRWLNREVV